MKMAMFQMAVTGDPATMLKKSMAAIREAAANGAELFEWEIRVQTFQNAVAIAMCNRVGQEDAMEFAGESLAADANGTVLLKAGDAEEILYAEIDVEAIRTARASRSYLTLRRTDMYR